jgi:hypothetical protein
MFAADRRITKDIHESSIISKAMPRLISQAPEGMARFAR